MKQLLRTKNVQQIGISCAIIHVLKVKSYYASEDQSNINMMALSHFADT